MVRQKSACPTATKCNFSLPIRRSSASSQMLNCSNPHSALWPRPLPPTANGVKAGASSTSIKVFKREHMGMTRPKTPVPDRISSARHTPVLIISPNLPTLHRIHERYKVQEEREQHLVNIACYLVAHIGGLALQLASGTTHLQAMQCTIQSPTTPLPNK